MGLFILLFVTGCSLFNDQQSSELEGAVVVADTQYTKLTQNGDLVLTTGTKEFKNTTLEMKGNIILQDKTKLVLDGVDLYFLQDYNLQYGVSVKGSATLILKNVRIFTNGKWMNFNYQDKAKVEFLNVTSDDPNVPWHGTSGDVTVVIKSSTIGMTLADSVTVQAENSNLFLEIVLRNIQATLTFPQGYQESYQQKINNGGETISINATKSTFRNWGVTLDRNTIVTFNDSNLTIGLNSYHTATAKNLKKGLHNSTKVDFDTNILTLKKTFISSWYPQAQDGATIYISNSDLADVNWNSADSTIIVNQSTASIAHARNGAKYEFYNSVIEGDVVAESGSTILLKNTKVGGQIKEITQGKVLVK